MCNRQQTGVKRVLAKDTDARPSAAERKHEEKSFPTSVKNIPLHWAAGRVRPPHAVVRRRLVFGTHERTDSCCYRYLSFETPRLSDARSSYTIL
eukprot:scaffold37521_cov75-Phaeocystis_antarctica.AAC.3